MIIKSDIPSVKNNHDIVSIINDQDITKLGKEYNIKLINIMKQEFNTFEQNLFLASFCTYLQYDQYKDFVVQLDKIWEWLGYSRIDPCKRTLISNFKENYDFIIEKSAPQFGGAVLNGGQNKETIKLTVNCFKELCLLTRTSKAKEVRKYYIKLEEVFHKFVLDESLILKKQLEDQSKQLEEQARQLKDKELVSL